MYRYLCDALIFSSIRFSTFSQREIATVSTTLQPCNYTMCRKYHLDFKVSSKYCVQSFFQKQLSLGYCLYNMVASGYFNNLIVYHSTPFHSVGFKTLGYIDIFSCLGFLFVGRFQYKQYEQKSLETLNFISKFINYS